ncbi:MAG: DUF1840 family protein, partial [Betaproteobacteria bacterium]
MLVTFKSKAAAEILMYATHAKPILDLLGKDTERGVITADETEQAIARIESEIASRKFSKPASSQLDDEVVIDPIPRATDARAGFSLAFRRAGAGERIHQCRQAAAGAGASGRGAV